MSSARPRKVTISTQALLDERLSYAARGLLAAIMARGKTASPTLADMIAGSPAGREAVHRMLAELQAHGYVLRAWTNGKAGRFAGVTRATDCPAVDGNDTQPSSAEPCAAEPLTVEPCAAEPLTVEPLTAEPLTAEPLTAEPLTAEPLTVEPLTAEPLTAEPLTAGPCTVQPCTANPYTVASVNRPSVAVVPPRPGDALPPSPASPARGPHAYAPHARVQVSPNHLPIKEEPLGDLPQAAMPLVPTFANAQVGPAPVAPGNRASAHAREVRPAGDAGASDEPLAAGTPARPRRHRREKPPADPRMAEMVQALEVWQGYPVVSWPREMIGAKKLLTLGYDLDVVERVWHEMKHDSDDFWQDKHLSLQSVAGQIGARLAKRRRGPINLDDRNDGYTGHRQRGPLRLDDR